tara:strand:+ start:1293 stop:2078 length:786 start_codon:yes stop_codon:yes gene_type:complete
MVRKKENIMEVIENIETVKEKPLATLAKEAGIAYTTLLFYHRKKGFDVPTAIKHSIEGKQREIARKLNRKLAAHGVSFDSVAQLAKSNFNKFNIDVKTLQKRIYKEKITPEKALEKQVRPRKKPIYLTLPNGERKSFSSIKEGYLYLQEHFNEIKLNAFSTVVEYIARGKAVEVAFGYKDPEWKQNNSALEELVRSGYNLIGELKPNCKAVIIPRDKEIYSSVKVFSKSKGWDYSNISKRLKKGDSPEQILDSKIKKGKIS